VLLGDVRSLPLLGAFHESVARAERPLTEEEKELLLDPAFFAGLGEELAGVSSVEVLLKRAVHHNELSRFRYDALLHVGGGADAVTVPIWLDWEAEGMTLASLRGLLSDPAGNAIGITTIPNARVEEGVDPQHVWILGEELGFAVECSWASADPRGAFDAVFLPGGPGTHRVVRWPGPRDTVTPRPLYTDPLAGRQRAERSGLLAAELRSTLRASLPEYMVPSAFVCLDALPLTPNGKVDRAALPAPVDRRPGRDAGRAGPRTATEGALAVIWAEVLGVDALGVDDDFFDLGGHSLLAVRVISKVREAFAVEVPLRAMFDTPTIAGLGRTVDDARGGAPSGGPPLVPVDRREGSELPLSFAQEPLWFLDQLVPDNPFFTMPSAYRLMGAVDVAALERALSEIVYRHEILRTSFPAPGGRPSQRIAPPAPVVVPVDDLRRLGPGPADAEARRRAAAEAGEPFDLTRSPLLRARLLRLGDQEHVLLLTAHHIVSDGWSTGVLLGELSALYGAFGRGEPSLLHPLAVQYADYAVWQRQWLEGEVLEAHLRYWQAALAGAPAALELDADHPRPPLASYRGAMHRFEVPAAVVGELRALGRASGATLQMTLLAAFKALLARATGADDVVVAVTASGRGRGEIEHLVGLFVNTLALRTDLSDDPGFDVVVQRVRRATLEALDHQDAPFDKVVERVKPPRDLGRNPVVQVAFEFQHHVPAPADLGGLVACTDIGGYTGAEYGAADGEGITARLDVELFVVESADGSLAATLVYATDLYERATIVGLVGQYRRLLTAVVADPTARLSELPLSRGGR